MADQQAVYCTLLFVVLFFILSLGNEVCHKQGKIFCVFMFWSPICYILIFSCALFDCCALFGPILKHFYNIVSLQHTISPRRVMTIILIIYNIFVILFNEAIWDWTVVTLIIIYIIKITLINCQNAFKAAPDQPQLYNTFLW